MTLLEAARIVARGGDLDSELGALAEHVRGATGALASAVYLLDPVAGQLVVAAAAGIDEPTIAAAEPISIDDEQSIAARVAAERRALTGGAAPSVFGDLATAAMGQIALPLIAADANGAEDVEGVLVALFAGEAPDPDAAEDPLFALADLCAVAIRKARLANRATFERMLELEIARARRQQLELSVVVFDVDDFTGLNEREGHAAGDDVLRRLASLLADQVRLVDTIGRLGGDELGLIAPGGGGAVVAGRVRDAASQMRTRGGVRPGLAAPQPAGRRPLPPDPDSAEVAAAISSAVPSPSRG
jgi:hypothetical protein